MYDLYKGYIPTKNKAALKKFKNAKLDRLEDVKNLDEYAGVLNDDTILVDVDDMEQSDILLNIVKSENLKCKVYATSRGKHFLFLNSTVQRCITGGGLACGIAKVDIKVGAQYEVLKYDGVLREVLYDTEDYEYIPNWMMPLKTSKVFSRMENGDGRNTAIFKHVSALMQVGISKNDIISAIKILNKYVFTDKLPDDEIAKLLRDERFAKPSFFKGEKFLHAEFSRWMRDNYSMCKINNDLYTYNGYCYTNDIREVKRQMIQEVPTLKDTQRTEVYKYLDLIVDDHAETEARYICFDNGIYDIITETLMPFSPSYIVTNKVNADYYEEAYDAVVDKALLDFANGNESIKMLLEEMIGYCLYRRNELRKAFILVGDKQNGKSTFLQMLNAFVGIDNTVALDLAELGDRFKTAQLSGKLVCAGDDIEDNFISNLAIFKKLVTGNPVNAERKGQDPFDFSNYAKLIFSANNVPRMNDKTGAVMSRLILVPFTAHFEPGDEGFDLEIIDKLTTPSARSHLARVAMEGLKRVLKKRAFTTGAEVENTLKEYVTANNSVLLFMQEEKPKVEHEPVADVFTKYQLFCYANNIKPMSKINFSKQMKLNFGFNGVPKNIKGKGIRCFEKVTEQ